MGVSKNYKVTRRKEVEKKGVVFNIQRFTIHDGPGLRTEIFLKGPRVL